MLVLPRLRRDARHAVEHLVHIDTWQSSAAASRSRIASDDAVIPRSRLLMNGTLERQRSASWSCVRPRPKAGALVGRNDRGGAWRAAGRVASGGAARRFACTAGAASGADAAHSRSGSAPRQRYIDAAAGWLGESEFGRASWAVAGSADALAWPGFGRGAALLPLPPLQPTRLRRAAERRPDLVARRHRCTIRPSTTPPNPRPTPTLA